MEKDIYEEVSDSLSSIETDLLTLRLESSYKTKEVTSSNDAVIYATASTSADSGNHSVTVKQTAKNATWSSHYTRTRISGTGAGVTGTSGLPEDYLEGVHNVTVSDTGSAFVAKDSFEPDNWGTLKKRTGDDVAITDSEGALTGDITAGTLDFEITDDDGTYNISVTLDALTGDDINSVTKQIEDQVNSALNDEKGTTDTQYTAVRADYDSGAGTWKIAVYSRAIDDMDISVTGGTAAADLGLDSDFTSTKSTTTINQYHVGADEADLLTKLNDADSGLIPGVTLTSSGLTEGTFKITQDASLKVSSASYSTVSGAVDVSDSGTLDLLTEGLENTGFARDVNESTNGTFTINDVEITIEDYTTLSLNDLLATINSSGAGVTASYDSGSDRIVLTNNDTGSTSISVGDTSDTSNILTVLQLTSSTGATKTTGGTDGTLDSTAVLNQAGFSATPTTGTFTINGVSIYIDASSDSLDDVIKKVNNSGAGVTMAYDSNSDKITVLSDSMDKITFGSPTDTSNFLLSVNLTRDTNTEQALGTEGQYAILDVDGVTYVRETNEIDDIIKGVTLSARAASDSAININISTDTSKATKALASFVQHYNELMSSLNVPTLDDDEKEYLTALTDEDKESMTDDEISEYQAYYDLYHRYDIIGKSSELRSLRTNLRGTLFNEISGISGSVTNLQELGLDIAGDGDYDVEKLGYLVTESSDYDTILEELEGNETLQEILLNNPDDVYEFFSANIIVGEDDDDDGVYETNDIKGWSRVYSSMLDRYTDYDGMIEKKITTSGTLDTEMDRLAKDIEMYEDRADKLLERYWSQFTAMEQAISEAQSQGDALASLTGGSSS
jgi:flagellar hook-associated protein 2